MDKLTQQSYIRRFDLENPDTYIPLEVGYEFLNKVQRLQGIDNISGEFYSGFDVKNLGEYAQIFATCPDLYSVLLNGIKFDHMVQTHGKLQLAIEGAYSWFTMRHLDPPSKGRHISEQINVAMILDAFQYVLGTDWTPIELHITSKDGQWLNQLMPTSDYTLKTSCSEIAFCFRTSELSAKNRFFNFGQDFSSQDMHSIEAVTDHVFNSLNSNSLPTIEEFAEYFGYSKWTVIRSFKETGSSFKDKVEKHLFMRSLQFLEDYSLSIEDISVNLGYAHPANFIRAFKRWTSMTPHYYRQHNARI